nr:hypothetical protein Iba_chr11aCG12440 [Ipomoea batatas]
MDPSSVSLATAKQHTTALIHSLSLSRFHLPAVKQRRHGRRWWWAALNEAPRASVVTVSKAEQRMDIEVESSSEQHATSNGDDVKLGGDSGASKAVGQQCKEGNGNEMENPVGMRTPLPVRRRLVTDDHGGGSLSVRHQRRTSTEGTCPSSSPSSKQSMVRGLAGESPCRSRLNHIQTPPFLFSLASGERRSVKSSINGDNGELQQRHPSSPVFFD